MSVCSLVPACRGTDGQRCAGPPAEVNPLAAVAGRHAPNARQRFLAPEGRVVDTGNGNVSHTGVIGGLRGDIEDLLTQQRCLGGLLRYDRAADWNEVRGLAYLRYRTE
jgi:hypothetical protein